MRSDATSLSRLCTNIMINRSSLEETIRNIWETSGLHVLKDDLISDLCNILVSGGRKYCNRLSESTFCLLLHIALRADGALAEAQQIIYILAVGINGRSNSPSTDKYRTPYNTPRRPKKTTSSAVKRLPNMTSMLSLTISRTWKMKD